MTGRTPSPLQQDETDVGRIADALKKAERERRESHRLAGESPLNAVRAVQNDGLRTAAPAKTDDPRTARLPAVRTPPAVAPSAAFVPAVSPGGPVPTVQLASNWDPALVMMHERAGAVAEQYRAVRTWLLAHNSTGEHRTFAITSSLPREGKSVTTANLGIALSEVRHLSVLLVDADLRRRALAKLFGPGPDLGLTDVVSGRCPLARAIRPTAFENLSILPAGTDDGRLPAELLSGRNTGRLFDEIRERYHYVLVDTPPVQAIADVGIVAGMCTGVLLVVRMARTHSAIVQQSVRWLQSNNVQVIGCIAAGRRRRDDSTVSDPNQH
jgi:capsular exopolysaccharide synthesis family protein